MQIQKVLSSTWNNNNIERWSDNLIIGRHISFPANKAKIHRKSDLVLFAPTVTVINAGKVKVNMTFSSPASRGAKKTNTGETSKGQNQTKQQTDGRLEGWRLKWFLLFWQKFVENGKLVDVQKLENQILEQTAISFSLLWSPCTFLHFLVHFCIYAYMCIVTMISVQDAKKTMNTKLTNLW